MVEKWWFINLFCNHCLFSITFSIRFNCFSFFLSLHFISHIILRVFFLLDPANFFFFDCVDTTTVIQMDSSIQNGHQYNFVYPFILGLYRIRFCSVNQSNVLWFIIINCWFLLLCLRVCVFLLFVHDLRDGNKMEIEYEISCFFSVNRDPSAVKGMLIFISMLNFIKGHLVFWNVDDHSAIRPIQNQIRSFMKFDLQLMPLK